MSVKAPRVVISSGLPHQQAKEWESPNFPVEWLSVLWKSPNNRAFSSNNLSPEKKRHTQISSSPAKKQQRLSFNFKISRCFALNVPSLPPPPPKKNKKCFARSPGHSVFFTMAWLWSRNPSVGTSWDVVELRNWSKHHGDVSTRGVVSTNKILVISVFTSFFG